MLYVIYIVYGREVHSRYIRPEATYLPRLWTMAMDRPTVLYILYTMVSAQQTNLLPKNASRNDAIFAQKVYRIYATTSQYLSSYGCTITMVLFIYIYNVNVTVIYVTVLEFIL